MPINALNNNPVGPAGNKLLFRPNELVSDDIFFDHVDIDGLVNILGEDFKKLVFASQAGVRLEKFDDPSENREAVAPLRDLFNTSQYARNRRFVLFAINSSAAPTSKNSSCNHVIHGVIDLKRKYFYFVNNLRAADETRSVMKEIAKTFKIPVKNIRNASADKVQGQTIDNLGDYGNGMSCRLETYTGCVSLIDDIIEKEKNYGYDKAYDPKEIKFNPNSFKTRNIYQYLLTASCIFGLESVASHVTNRNASGSIYNNDISQKIYSNVSHIERNISNILLAVNHFCANRAKYLGHNKEIAEEEARCIKQAIYVIIKFGKQPEFNDVEIKRALVCARDILRLSHRKTSQLKEMQHNRDIILSLCDQYRYTKKGDPTGFNCLSEDDSIMPREVDFYETLPDPSFVGFGKYDFVRPLEFRPNEQNSQNNQNSQNSNPSKDAPKPKPRAKINKKRAKEPTDEPRNKPPKELPKELGADLPPALPPREPKKKAEIRNTTPEPIPDYDQDDTHEIARTAVIADSAAAAGVSLADKAAEADSVSGIEDSQKLIINNTKTDDEIVNTNSKDLPKDSKKDSNIGGHVDNADRKIKSRALLSDRFKSKNRNNKIVNKPTEDLQTSESAEGQYTEVKDTEIKGADVKGVDVKAQVKDVEDKAKKNKNPNKSVKFRDEPEVINVPEIDSTEDSLQQEAQIKDSGSYSFVAKLQNDELQNDELQNDELRNDELQNDENRQATISDENNAEVVTQNQANEANQANRFSEPNQVRNERMPDAGASSINTPNTDMTVSNNFFIKPISRNDYAIGNVKFEHESRERPYAIARNEKWNLSTKDRADNENSTIVKKEICKRILKSIHESCMQSGIDHETAIITLRIAEQYKSVGNLSADLSKNLNISHAQIKFSSLFQQKMKKNKVSDISFISSRDSETLIRSKYAIKLWKLASGTGESKLLESLNKINRERGGELSL